MKAKSRALPWILAAGTVVALTSVANGAATSEDSSDVIELLSALDPAVRLGLYGLVIVTLCLVSRTVPDAPLLAYMFSMPMVQFSGLRIALALLQCGIVFLRVGSISPFLASWPLSAFLLCIVASPSWALYPQESLFGEEAGVMAMLLQLPLAIAAAALVRSQLTSIRRLLWALVFGCIPGCFLTIKNALSGVRYLQDNNEYYMGFIRPDVFSPMLVMGGILLLLCLTSPGVRLLKRTLVALILLLFCVSLLLTGIRSGYVAFGVAAFLLLLWMRSWVALGGIVAVAALIGLLSYTTARQLDMEGKVSERWSERSMGTGETRIHYWDVAAAGFLRRPVMGIGWGCFPVFAADNTVGKEAATHNIFVRIACELGTVGFLLFLTWIGITALRLRRHPQGALTVVLMIGILVQGLFLDHFICSYFWLFLGLCDGASAGASYKGRNRVGNWNWAVATPTFHTR